MSSNTDIFGIKKIYSSSVGGRKWESKWNNGRSRNWTGGWWGTGADPYDSEFICFGNGSYKVTGDGILKITGEFPRMFILDPVYETSPSTAKTWRNVEVTVYGKRVLDYNIDGSYDYAGIMAYVRTNHIAINVDVPTADPCDSRGVSGKFNYNGILDFEKEIKHDISYAWAGSTTYWPNGMPHNTWIGYKYVVYDLQNGDTKYELYIDETGGLNGGTWVKVDEFTDDGTNFGTGFTPCREGIDPALRLNASESRLGSESGRPNVAIYFRSDNVGTDGLWFKNMSIREIVVCPQVVPALKIV